MSVPFRLLCSCFCFCSSSVFVLVVAVARVSLTAPTPTPHPTPSPPPSALLLADRQRPVFLSSPLPASPVSPVTRSFACWTLDPFESAVASAHSSIINPRLSFRVSRPVARLSPTPRDPSGFSHDSPHLAAVSAAQDLTRRPHSRPQPLHPLHRPSFDNRCTSTLTTTAGQTSKYKPDVSGHVFGLGRKWEKELDSACRRERNYILVLSRK